MFRKLAISAVLLMAAAAILLVPRVLDALREDVRPPARRKQFARTFAEGVRVDHPDAPEADLLRCGACRIEKLRKGPFTLGGVNVLVLEDLQVTLSDSMAPREKPSDGDDRGPSAREVLGTFGSVDRFLSLQGVRGRFSDLRIERLEVLRLEGTNAVPFFSAARGEACRDGLKLSKCSVASEEGVAPHDALLRVRPRPRLEWAGGGIDLFPGKASD